MDPRPLSFALLDETVSRYAEETASDERGGRGERWSMMLGFGAGGAGLVLGKALAGTLAIVLVSAAFTVEVIGLSLWLALMIRREWRHFRMPHARYASELDKSYATYRRLVLSLSDFSQAELQGLLRYLKARRESLVRQTGLVSGNLDRLGLLPLLAMLYVQFKGWRFGDWMSLWSSVHLVGGLLIWAVFLAYLGAWWLVRLRMRLDVYQSFLEEALEADATPANAPMGGVAEGGASL